MSRSILIRLQFFVVFFVMATSTLLTPASNVGLDVSSSGYYLSSDDIIAFEVVETSEDGIPGLTIELQNHDEETFNATLEAGEEIGMRIEFLADWNVNTSEQTIIGGSTNGGYFDLVYAAPYNASLANGDGPAYFMPVITIGDDTYWFDFETVVEGLGFSVTNNGTHFTMSQTTADYFVDVAWTKSDGVLSHYRYEFTEEAVDKVMEITRADWDLIASQAETLGFSTMNPLLDYRVIEAVDGELNGAFDFGGINIEEENENGPIDGHGIIHVGDRLQVDIHDYRTEDGMGYIFELGDEGSFLTFNTTIEIPDENPQYNNMYLYPQFVVADSDILDGYLHAAEFVSDAYTTSMNATHFTIEYDHVNGTIDAEWEIDTGFLTSWRINNSEEGQILALELIAGADLEDFDINWDHITPDNGNTYQVLQLSIEGEDDEISFEEDSNPGSGYLAETDFFYVNPQSASTTLDDTPPTVFYDINATNGYQQNVSISVNYPGWDTVETDGPPLLYFHHLGGSTTFFDWVELLYDETGGSYAQNGTHIIMSYSNVNVTFEQVFRVSDLAMVSYYYEDTEQGVILEIAIVSDENLLTDLDTDITEDTPDGLELPMFDGLTELALVVLFVAIPILRRRNF